MHHEVEDMTWKKGRNDVVAKGWTNRRRLRRVNVAVTQRQTDGLSYDICLRHESQTMIIANNHLMAANLATGFSFSKSLEQHCHKSGLSIQLSSIISPTLL